MQKIATRIFISASICFGILGIYMVLANSDPGAQYGFNLVVARLFMASVFVILPSFAVSVAGKYLNGK